MTLSLLIIVAARGGSKRIPNKNILPLAGHSLIARTARTIEQANLGAPVLLTTDDERLAEEARNVGMPVPFLRPAELASDTASSEAAVLHALDWWQSNHGETPELTMLLQPTSPFRTSDLLRDAVGIMEQDPDADGVVAVKPLHVKSNHLYLRDGNYLRQAVPTAGETCFAPTGALYVVRTAALREYGSFYPPRLQFVAHEGISTLDIDTPEDWKIAELLAASKTETG